MQLVRGTFIALITTAIATAAFSSVTLGQNYPSQSVRVIVPAAPGGPSDIIGRLIAQKLSESLGQSFYVENLPSGAGNVGVGIAAKAAPDGYTILTPTSA